MVKSQQLRETNLEVIILEKIYQVIATHKVTKERFVFFEGSKDDCMEKILRITPDKETSPETVNGERIWHFNLSLERKKE